MRTPSHLRLAAAALMLSLPAWAAEPIRFSQSFGDLVESCEADNVLEMQYCTGYVNAIADMLRALRDDSVCFPSRLTNQKMMDAVSALAKADPEARKQPAFLGTHRAYAEAFPCPKEEKPQGGAPEEKPQGAQKKKPGK
jgi:hypothetical protein